MTKKIYEIYLVVSPELHPLPATSAANPARCWELAEEALGASSAALLAKGYRVYTGRLELFSAPRSKNAGIGEV